MSGTIEQLKTTPKSLDYFDENRRLISAILAVLVGGLGIHKFYLGYTRAGFLAIFIVFCFWNKCFDSLN
ncbi:NINE protein [Aquimarina agarivorans]|uniref:NINE protein n=1 Tax=Aquimarina agarivorans TaxID=980584 RepID=UPI000248F585|nr:TM2 domain-containing protein [Aquimarina agarivorans]